MRGTLVLLIALSASPDSGHAQSASVSGSVAAETLLTPASGSSPLNPGNVARIDSNTNLGNAIVRLRLGDNDARWTVAMQGRAEVADGSSTAAGIGELYVSVSPTAWLTLAAGRIIEKWGSGYAWNPSAFIAPRKNPSDPGDRRGQLAGVDMIRADALFGSTSFGAYALDDGASAVRASRMFGATDISVYLHHEDQSTTPALSVSRVVGDALELHAEASTRSALVGAQYTFANQLNLVAELYHSREGLTGTQWDTFRADAASALDRESLLEVNRRFRPLQMQRDYLFLRAARQWSGASTTTELLAIAGLRDGSTLVRASLHYAIRPNLSLFAINTEFLGEQGSEMSYVQLERSTSFGAQIHF